MALAWLRNGADAEDAVQETFLRVLQNLHRYRPEAPFEHWVFTIGANVMRAQGRRRRPELPPGLSPPAPPSPQEALERREDLGKVIRAIAALDPDYRAPLVLRLRHGFEQDQIARLLGLSVEHVRVRLHRAVRQIRDLVRSEP
jgi:RNA polymerase sigma-70 factor (ECF subfamily)